MTRIDFSWRCQITADTSDAQLLNYLKDDEVIPLREKMLQSLRAFWKPLAYLHQPEGERLAIEAIYALEKHADYLRSQFGLELPKPKARRIPRVKRTVQEQPSTLSQLEVAAEGDFEEVF
ncbi:MULTISPECIES: hypothetical protein [unclassified Coleofasciculus]|uniref:hypothetical protein n=1 Tax=unclassified Coleofasciculus TaxID=2692782 RepID=UPI0018807F38|nr:MULTISPECIES: hypothetical protein [unclassified Coleofasciculus]MBE9128028.1 hypothetical protein [Coleofasciculus sp. LEGE 07081]MBE9150532.1 hypothetical protein [Coleofasciculus sp. LEGE 07092]